VKLKATLVVIFFCCAAFGYAHSQEKHLRLSADGIEVLRIDCGAGALVIQGSEILDQIEVTAEIVIKGVSENKAKGIIQDQVELSLERRGRKAVLISHFESRFSVISLGGKAIHLTVRVPERMDIDIEDGSGDIGVEHIAGDVRIDDGSGEIRVEGIKGDLVVDDGSGVIKVIGVKGDLEIDDGSGSLYARNIGGNVTLRDGSGSIDVSGVNGDVYLKDDGSGGVAIKDVKGRVVK